ncbi:uncharacterized protein BX663DRAFT_491580 [Cokeromyces recurvatus]|uniref:uncharacterized protein n=1 Tax=Cokeromyces recurvatus TaxID=90255 RepID=UPI0022203882|nr:uncharacterized protein BX663DRAFT_491580 [Cokeromyces recurvatus]KAI7907654.1 hypothetical protein BX663DRAFT_491580 [Cokeromyces recurvatus]
MEEKKAVILKLPNELLQYIFHLSSIRIKREEHQFLGWNYPEHSYEELTSIASCCRHFYLLCAPFLWKDKEFILPYESDEKSKSTKIQMATDILAHKALFQDDYQLGDYVRSLSRDLTRGVQFDLVNTQLMAQLLKNLHALRIEFHPLQRTEHYGLCYFLQYCPHLKELYLNHCHDTFDDFYSLVEYKPTLEAITLSNCTIKEATLSKLVHLFKPSLQRILLEYVLIEPSVMSSRRQHEQGIQLEIEHISYYYPHHFFSSNVKEIPTALLESLLVNHPYLTQFALTTDSISFQFLELMVQHAPLLEKLSIALHEVSPYYVERALRAIGQLNRLTTLSIVFKQCGSLSKDCIQLACHAPASAWTFFAKQLPKLRLFHISARRLIVTRYFLPTLFTTCTLLKYVMIHNLALSTDDAKEEEEEEEKKKNENENENGNRSSNKMIIENEGDEIAKTAAVRRYMKYCKSITYQLNAWDKEYQEDLYTFERALRRGFDYFDDGVDHLCFIRGFPPTSLNNFYYV